MSSGADSLLTTAQSFLEAYDLVRELEAQLAEIKRPILEALSIETESVDGDLKQAKELLTDLKAETVELAAEAEAERREKLKGRELAEPLNLPRRLSLTHSKEVQIVTESELPRDVFSVDSRRLKALMKARRGDVSGAAYVTKLGLRVNQ